MLNELFQPDLYNWASLANIERHQHVHLIPRYKSTRTFKGVTFEDKRWGMNPAPHDDNFRISPTLFQEIKTAIKSRMHAIG